MIVRYVMCLVLLSFAMVSCQTNDVSKIPRIDLATFTPQIIQVNRDTAFLVFDIEDGDADIGIAAGGGSGSDLFIIDARYAPVAQSYAFPDDIDQSILDPKKGIKGRCTFIFTPDLLIPRIDPIHAATKSDTTHFEVYIVDKAGHESNHISTPPLVMWY